MTPKFSIGQSVRITQENVKAHTGKTGVVIAVNVVPGKPDRYGYSLMVADRGVWFLEDGLSELFDVVE